LEFYLTKRHKAPIIVRVECADSEDPRLELRRVTPYHRCHGLLPVGLHYPTVRESYGFFEVFDLSAAIWFNIFSRASSSIPYPAQLP
jgi:hypothetical protein